MSPDRVNAVMTIHLPKDARTLARPMMLSAPPRSDPAAAAFKDVTSRTCVECGEPVLLRPEKGNGWVCDRCEERLALEAVQQMRDPRYWQRRLLSGREER